MLSDSTMEREKGEKEMGQRWRRDAVDAECPTNSPLPQIWPKPEVLGQVPGVSQITVAPGATLWPSERSILVRCKAVAEAGVQVVKLVHGL